MSDKYSRLPKWAQDEISRLRRIVDERDSHIAVMSGDVHTRTYVEDFDKPRQWIKSHSNVVFETKSGNVIAALDLSFNLNIRSWSGPLIIRPSASNSISVEVDQ